MVVSWRIDFEICIGVLFGVIQRLSEGPGAENWDDTLFQRVPYFWSVRCYSNTTPNHFLIRFPEPPIRFYSFKKKFFLGPPNYLSSYRRRISDGIQISLRIY